MTGKPAHISRMRAYFGFLTALIYFFAANSVASHSAAGLVNRDWSPLVSQSMLVFLLIFGFSAFGILFHHQQNAIREQGLPIRKGMADEAGIGIAVGWGIAVFSVVVLALFGGIAIVLNMQPAAWFWLLPDAAFFAVAALAEEVAFRGYPFQCFVETVGPLGASLAFAVLYAGLESLRPGSNTISFAVSIVFSLVLSLAYQRTRALWVGWGINFGWKASRALLFGLVVSGVSAHSSVVEGDPMGPLRVTGGGFGLDASWLSFILFLIALPLVYRLTRDLDFRFNAPVIIPGGFPVDLEAAARSQHEQVTRSAMDSPSAPATLVQIAPAVSHAVPTPVATSPSVPDSPSEEPTS